MFAALLITTALMRPATSAAATPTVSVGTALADGYAPGYPDFSEPDVDFGTADLARTPVPFSPATSRAYHMYVQNNGSETENITIEPGPFASASPSSVTLGPGAETVVPVIIAVPAGTPDGLYNGTTWAEACGGPASGGFGITDCVRSGVVEQITVTG